MGFGVRQVEGEDPAAGAYAKREDKVDEKGMAGKSVHAWHEKQDASETVPSISKETPAPSHAQNGGGGSGNQKIVDAKRIASIFATHHEVHY
ncbi:MAG: hypothetical protein LBG65_03055 [Puniceicoccales bacterium]|jgi:hypothetical protein|nr:hypothetical protein [Puniceicoccales bacterium]